jgi:hypothetical protein
MIDIAPIIAFFVLLILGPPAALLIMGLNKQKKNDYDSAKVYFIFALMWLIVAGGACATMTLM